MQDALSIVQTCTHIPWGGCLEDNPDDWQYPCSQQEQCIVDGMIDLIVGFEIEQPTDQPARK